MAVEGYRDEFGFVGPAPLEHPARRNPEPHFPTGPAVGERVPEFQLPNQYGELIDFHAARGHHKAALMFQRSAVWWPFCMTQLVELQRRLPDFQAAGMKIFAVSYDPQEGLTEFAQTYGITYDLLSDGDSAVIKRFGILNTLIDPTEPEAAAFYGIPYPGTYIVDESGVVLKKYFNQHLATRDAPERFLDEAVGQVVLSADAPQLVHQDGDVRVSVFLPGGNLKLELTRQLYCRLDIRDGLHIYAEPVPTGFVATEVTVQGRPGLRLGKPAYPPATPLVMEELGLELPAWEGTVDIGIPITATTDLLNVLKPLDQKAITLDLTVRYQACSTRECFLPRTVNLSLEVPLGQGIVPDLPQFQGGGLRVSPLQTGAYLAQLAARRQEE